MHTNVQLGRATAHSGHRVAHLPQRSLASGHRRLFVDIRAEAEAPGPRNSTVKVESAPSQSKARTPGSQEAAIDARSSIAECEASTSGSIQQLNAWDRLPARYKIVLATCGSFVICNMDKVNMSVAILPMAQDFGWSSSVSGIVQSSFFYGYMLCQLPGGYLSSKIGGRKVLPSGVALWSVATATVPLLASTIPGLCISRAAVGLGEAVAPSAATDMVARCVPPEERSRAVSFIFSGLHIGSVLGLLAAPVLISKAGWQVVFVSFGLLGLVWAWWFEQVIAGIEKTEPEVVARLIDANALSSVDEEPSSSAGGHGGHGGVIQADMVIPYRAFLRSQPVQALMFTHFCNNWFHYTMLAWLPTYFTDTLSVDLMHAAQTALLPPLAGIAASAAAGPMADGLISRGVPVPTVRKLAQGVAFMVPTAVLLGACTPAIADNSTLTVASITIALGVSSFSLAGLYCTHQDMSPKYASAMLGLTNTAGAFPGIVGVAVVGFLYDQTQSWELGLFVPSAVFMAMGTLVYSLLGRNHPIDFDAMDNSPFAFEKYLPRLPWSKDKEQ